MTTSLKLVAVPGAPTRVRRVLSTLMQGYSLVLLWILMILLLIAVVPGNVSVLNALRAVLGQQTPLIFLGLAVVITMAVGELDLSFAAIFGISAVTTPALVVLHGWPYPLAVAAALGIALVFGAINAVLVVGIGINSVVVTLGVSSVAGGLALLVADETTVSGLDPGLSVIALARFLGLPLVFWYGIVLVAIVAYVMTATPLGRHMLFVGSNRSVARLAGVAVSRVRIGAFLVSALLCGLAGVVISTGLGGFNPSSAATMLLQTFAAVFLGTVAVVPGRFNPVGMAIAAYFLLTRRLRPAAARADRLDHRRLLRGRPRRRCHGVLPASTPGPQLTRFRRVPNNNRRNHKGVMSDEKVSPHARHRRGPRRRPHPHGLQLEVVGRWRCCVGWRYVGGRQYCERQCLGGRQCCGGRKPVGRGDVLGRLERSGDESGRGGRCRRRCA